MAQQKYDVFISYRRDGGIDSAVALQSTLKHMHYRVFLDVDSMHTGRFDTTLLDRIKECQDFLLVLSPGALTRCRDENDWVRREIEYAISLKKNIIPIICDGGSVAERLNVELPESLSSLPLYNVLETNLVQLHAMTDLLRSSLTAKPHSSARGAAIGAVIAVLVCIIVFGAGSIIKANRSVYPRTQRQKNLVSQALSYTSLSLSEYNTVHGAYLDALDKTKLYLNGSPQVTRSELSARYGNVLDAIESAKERIAEADAALLDGLADSPLSTADLAAMAGALDSCLDELSSSLLYLEYDLLDDAYTLSTHKLAWVECYATLEKLTADNMILSLNSLFLPLSEEALDPLLRTYLPLLTSMYDGTWYSTQAQITARDEAIYAAQQKAITDLGSLVTTSEGMLEHEQKLAEYRLKVKEEKLSLARKELEELKAALAAQKNKLYEVHRPVLTDDADLLFSKGTMFLSFDMLDAAVECFTMYGESDASNARIIGKAAGRFALYQAETGIHAGLIVCLYEDGKTPQPDVQIGDIIYAVNGTEVVYFEDYAPAKNGNAASELQVLRFTDAGFERLTVHLDPDAGLLGLRTMTYPPSPQ